MTTQLFFDNIFIHSKNKFDSVLVLTTKIKMSKKYQKKEDLRQHIIDIPDTYIGAISNEPRDTFLCDYDSETQNYYLAEVTFPESIERLFLEGISNSGNNADETRREGKDPGAIWIWADEQNVIIKNTGNSVPIIENEENPEFLNPEMIFGTLMTSSNYDQNVPRMGCGKNGFGAKLINIFSKKFWVDIKDPINHKEYHGVWRNNMTKHKIGDVTDMERKDKEGYVQVGWRLDFNRFDMECYPQEAIKSFARYAIDFSYTCKVPVYFNDILCDKRKPQDFLSLFLPAEEAKKAIFYYEWEPNFSPPLNDKGEFNTKKIDYSKHIAKVELIIADTPDAGFFHSYVNGLITQGGVHVNAVNEIVTKHIANVINDRATFTKKITVKDVKPHISFVLNCRLVDPAYKEQSKINLVKPKIDLSINENHLKKIMKWSCIDAIYTSIYSKLERDIAKTDAKKKKYVDSDKGEDANMAGGKNADKCDFYIVEGNSAGAYLKKRRDLIGGKNVIGYAAIRGKPLNVTNAGPEQIYNNKEIAMIKQFLGLCEGLDYTLPENYKTLRYKGKIVFCADADTDGMHIIGMLINYFNERFPSLQKLGILYYLKIAMIKVKDRHDQIVERFYSYREFKDHAERYTDKKKYNIQYFKGLATSSNPDIHDDISTASLVQINEDTETQETLTHAFDKNYADVRKLWIEEFDDSVPPMIEDDGLIDIVVTKNVKKGKKKAPVQEILQIPRKIQDITDYIKKNLMLFTMDNLFRAIPSMYDGLKQSQRKILWVALQHWGKGMKNKQMKVSQFGAKVADKTAYLHGPKSLENAIIKFAQGFVGANNLPFFEAWGQFGCRDDGGVGADVPDGRYPNVKLAKWCKIAFPADLMKLLPGKEEEGEIIEPASLPCIIPMHVINGSTGIATGYSNGIVKHNIYDVISWLRARFEIENYDKENLPVLVPFYNGFKGRIVVDDKTVNEAVIGGGDELADITLEEYSEDKEEVEEIIVNRFKRTTGKSMKSYGIYTFSLDKKEENVIEITELPIGVWLKNYRKWLTTLRENKLLKSFDDLSTSEEPHYILYGFTPPDGKKISYETLGLVKAIGMSNITLIDDNAKPYIFNDIHDVMEAYYNNMIKLFDRLRESQLQNYLQQIEFYQKKKLFLELVESGELIIARNRSKNKILEDLEKHNIPYNIYTSMKYCENEEDEIANIEEKILTFQKLYEDYTVIRSQDLWDQKLKKLEQII